MPVFRSFVVAVLYGLIALGTNARADEEFQMDWLETQVPGAGRLLENFRDAINNCDAELLDQITHDHWFGVGLPFTEYPVKFLTIRHYREQCEDGHTFDYEIQLSHGWYYDDGYVNLFSARGNRIDQDGEMIPSNLFISIFVATGDEGEHLIRHHHASEQSD